MFKLDKVNWYVKPSVGGAYVEQPQPTEYKIDLEDLDANSYRSIVTGNLIDSPISINWSKCGFEFSNLTEAQAYSLLQTVSKNPIYAKIENPVFPNGFVEAQFRCSKKSLTKLKTQDKRYSVSFNLVQKNKVTGM